MVNLRSNAFKIATKLCADRGVNTFSPEGRLFQGMKQIIIIFNDR
jgi:hypothetical protein